MATRARFEIRSATTNGPFVYEVEIIGTPDIIKADVGLPTVAAAIDAIKPVIAGIPGIIKKITADILIE